MTTAPRPNMELGRTAFEAYCKCVNGHTHDGREIPAWEDLGAVVQLAWAMAAQAAAVVTARAMGEDLQDFVTDWRNGVDMMGAAVGV